MRALLGTWFSRGISRLVPEIQCRIPAAGKRKIVLTIDDGPTGDGTTELCEVLAEHRVRAIFFLIGSNAVTNRQNVRGLVGAGHVIGNHSWTHIDAWRVPARTLYGEMRRCTTVLEDLTGRRIAWARPPFGRVTRSLVKWCRRHDQQMLLWDVMPPDFEPKTTIDQTAGYLERKVRPGSIVCLHDNAKARRITAAALRLAIPRLQAAGWEFCVPVA